MTEARKKDKRKNQFKPKSEKKYMQYCEGENEKHLRLEVIQGRKVNINKKVIFEGIFLVAAKMQNQRS